MTKAGWQVVADTNASSESGGGLALLVIVGFLAYATYRVIRHVKMRQYFASDEFRRHRASVAAVVREHNEVAAYASDIQREGTYALGGSVSGAQAHLAAFQNTSRWNYRRDRHVASYAAPNVHNCSLQVVRNASADPLKYVMKYFDLKANEPNLERVEKLGEDIARLEAAMSNLQERERSIADAVAPPTFIRKHYGRRLLGEIGAQLPALGVPYPVYVFEYVSAGGNSSQRTTVTLDGRVIDALVSTMADRIRWRKSVEGQRALMTAKLRDSIKRRDNFTCQSCAISVMVEPHLLLEVDHVIPLSRGGLSIERNLQTLCWRCNRTKSNKIPAA